MNLNQSTIVSGPQAARQKIAVQFSQAVWFCVGVAPASRNAQRADSQPTEVRQHRVQTSDWRRGRRFIRIPTFCTNAERECAGDNQTRRETVHPGSTIKET